MIEGFTNLLIKRSKDYFLFFAVYTALKVQLVPISLLPHGY